MSKAFVKYGDGTVDNCDYDKVEMESEWITMLDIYGTVAAMYNLSKIRSVTLASSRGCQHKAFITSKTGVVDNCEFNTYDSDADFIYFYGTDGELISFHNISETRGIRFQLT